MRERTRLTEHEVRALAEIERTLGIEDPVLASRLRIATGRISLVLATIVGWVRSLRRSEHAWMAVAFVSLAATVLTLVLPVLASWRH